MKRGIALLMCLTFLLSGCARTSSEDHSGTPYNLYFQEVDPVTGAGTLRGETVYLEEDGLAPHQRAEKLLNLLLMGPRQENLKSAIPPGTMLLDLELESGQADVNLSTSYASLSGVALTLADYAITLTLTQLPDILSVHIAVMGRELSYRDRQIFTARDVLLAAEEDVVGTVPVSLYFQNSTGRLTKEDRVLDLYEGDTQVSALVRALENGPEAKDLRPVLPEGFQVRSVRMDEEICYVSLTSAQVESLPPGTGDRLMILRALRYSLLSLDSVEEVRFLVDGERRAESDLTKLDIS